jgi:CBS domain containing-hemolysin-like protein
MSRLGLFMLATPGLILFSFAAVDQGLPGPGELLIPLAIIAILVLINGFFVAAEFAIIAIRPSQVDQMVQEGNGAATSVQEILDSPKRQDQYIATAQLGITIASLGLGMYGEPKIAEFIEPYLTRLLETNISEALLHTIASIIALSILTYLHIVIGEMVPKSVALTSPERAVLGVSKPMKVFQKILGIPVRFLNWIGRGMLHILKISPAEGHARLHSPEEIELIVSESADSGLLLEEEEEIIKNIFDFGDRQVGQVMTSRTRVQALSVDMPVDQLLSVVTKSRHSRFPVYKEDLDHVIGILHLKDLARQRLSGNGGIDIRQILNPASAVPENKPVEQLLAAFKRQRLHMAVVLDEFGGLAGIVTLEDLVEEIVGEVRDEFDIEKEPLVELDAGVIEVAGTFLVDDLMDFVFLGNAADLPDVETVGGLIHSWLGRPPVVGDKVSAAKNSEVNFTVLDLDGLAVTRAKIEFPAEEGKEN